MINVSPRTSSLSMSIASELAESGDCCLFMFYPLVLAMVTVSLALEVAVYIQARFSAAVDRPIWCV